MYNLPLNCIILDDLLFETLDYVKSTLRNAKKPDGRVRFMKSTKIFLKKTKVSWFSGRRSDNRAEGQWDHAFE